MPSRKTVEPARHTDPVLVRIRGPFACFTREAMRGERVSYDIITPTAARGVLENIFWRQGWLWTATDVWVQSPIQHESLSRNEQGDIPKTERAVRNDLTGVQRRTLLLANVDYVVRAYLQPKPGHEPSEDDWTKMTEMSHGYIQTGKCHRCPYLGMRDHMASFHWVEDESQIKPIDDSQDFGWMPHRMLWERVEDTAPTSIGMFRAVMIRGHMKVPLEPDVVHNYHREAAA